MNGHRLNIAGSAGIALLFMLGAFGSGVYEWLWGVGAILALLIAAAVAEELPRTVERLLAGLCLVVSVALVLLYW